MEAHSAYMGVGCKPFGIKIMKFKAVHFSLILVFALLMGLGCSDESNSIYDLSSIWKCHHETVWTEELTKTKVEGTWNWVYVKCCGFTDKPYENSYESIGLSVEFKTDGTGILLTNDSSLTFTWTIEIEDGKLYGFVTEPRIWQISGRLQFCEDLMLCNSSYIDGGDYYFKKE